MLKTAASEFAAMGIDVMLNFAGTTNHVGMQGELNTLGVKPVWLSAPVSGNSSNELFAKTYNVTEIANGEIYTSYTHVPVEIGADDPVSKSCNEQYTAGTGETIEPNTFDYSAVMNVCLQIDIVAAALSTVGPEITQEKLIAALEDLPKSTNGRELGEVYWGPDGRFNTHQMGIVKYDGTTNTSKSTDEVIPLDD